MRGRPTVATSHIDKSFSDDFKRSMPGTTTRTIAAHFYCAAVYPLLSKKEAASEIPHLAGIYRLTEEDGGHGIKMKTEIIEQLGRMLEQDGYSEDDVIKIARIAAKAYHDGYKVKEIKEYIRHGRTTGEW